MDTDAARAARSANQWLESIEAYLAWRAGLCWRNDRFNYEREYYLDGLRRLRLAQLEAAQLPVVDTYGLAELLTQAIAKIPASVSAGMGERSTSGRGPGLPSKFPALSGDDAGRRAPVTKRSARATQGLANHSTRRTA